MPFIVDTSVNARYSPLMAQEPSHAKVAYIRPTTDSLYGDQKMPRRIVQLSTHKSLPDFMINAGSWIVSQAFKDILDLLGRGKNEFLPIRVVRKDGTPADQKYYYLDIREKRGAVDFANSKGSWVEMHGARVFLSSPPFRYAIKGEAVANVHVWREPEQIETTVFFSDELVAAVKHAKLKDLEYVKL